MECELFCSFFDAKFPDIDLLGYVCYSDWCPILCKLISKLPARFEEYMRKCDDVNKMVVKIFGILCLDDTTKHTDELIEMVKIAKRCGMKKLWIIRHHNICAISISYNHGMYDTHVIGYFYRIRELWRLEKIGRKYDPKIFDV